MTESKKVWCPTCDQDRWAAPTGDCPSCKTFLTGMVCDHSLPPRGKYVLVRLKNGAWTVAKKLGTATVRVTWKVWEGKEYLDKFVIGWMELPA